VRHIPPREFREAGYLQELNRRFLHPLGLALAVSVDEAGEETVGPIWDCRDDPEGVVFEDGVVDASKAARVSTELEERAPRRIEALGFVVQPVPGERPAHEGGAR